MRRMLLALTLSAALPSPAAAATTVGAESPEHVALRQLKDELLTAANKLDMDGILKHLHPNVVITWQNAEVSRGHAGVREYLESKTGGTNPIVKGFHTSVEIDELTALYGDTGIAYGSSLDHFDLLGGQSFDLHGRWTFVLVKEKGRWLAAAMHASTNLFDNPLLNAAKRAAIVASIVAFAVALVLGLFVGKRFLGR